MATNELKIDEGSMNNPEPNRFIVPLTDEFSILPSKKTIELIKFIINCDLFPRIKFLIM